MGVEMDIILHLNVSMPDGTEEVAMQWKFSSYQWNITMLVDNLVFHVKLEKGYCPGIEILTCNFCDEY